MPSTSGSEFTFTEDVWPVAQLGMSDTRQAEPTSWMDVSCYIHEAELFRGRERFNDRFQPATCNITFTNENGWADISGSAVNVPDAILRPGRQIRVGVRGIFHGTTTETTRWLWYGYIDQVVPDYDPVVHDVVTITAIDALGEAGQTITPAGPMVGMNETVTQRLNRVLDSIGWWGDRRNIAASSTRVQGVTLGGAAIDMMSVAADSAGGVVYGSMGGDVVFKDLNWELYDADIPPEGEIGNCDPGTPPIEGLPPYIDPTPGPVYNPCPPIPKPPECVDVCIAPAEGTVVEQGDSWRVFIHDGHIWYESAGHLWDMGEWTEEDNCIRICHEVPPPPPPNGPPPPPPPPEGCRNPPCVPTTPGVPKPWPFTVEFLGYTDGGLDDGPQTTVTVTGLTPGTDCMLVAMVNGICASTHVLDPFPVNGGSITMGSVVFEQIDVREVAGLAGAESYAAAIEIGRDDPGTVDVVVDWSDDAQSKYHIVTIWRVKGHRADLMNRMRVGAYLHAATWDRVGLPPTSPFINPPGKGFMQLPFQTAESAGTQLMPYTRLTDIVIAQSLAESPLAPFGATFSDTDGTWWTPAFAAAPGPVALTVSGMNWSDNFERADGTLGPNWVLGQGQYYYDAVHPFTIVDDAAEGTVAASDEVNQMVRIETHGPTQFVEVSVENVWPNGSVQLIAHANDDDRSCHVGYFFFNSGGDDVVSTWLVEQTDTDEVAQSFANTPHTFTHPVTCRLEVDADSTMRAIVDGVLVQTWTAPGTIPLGPRIGIACEFGTTDPGGGIIEGSPRFLSVGGGSSDDGFCDDFERAELGPDWAHNPLWSDPAWWYIDDGALTNKMTTVGVYSTMDLVCTHDFGEGVHNVEVTATDVFVETVPAGQVAGSSLASVDVELKVHVDPASSHSLNDSFLCRSVMNDPNPANYAIRWTLAVNDGVDVEDDSYYLQGEFPVDASGTPPVMTYRVEATQDQMKGYINGTLVGTLDYHSANLGHHTGLFMPWSKRANPTDSTVMDPDEKAPRILEMCTGSDSGGIVRKCSWVAGYRPDPAAPLLGGSPNVKWTEVNLGPDNIQSSQGTVVMESGAAFGFTWRSLNYHVIAPPSGAAVSAGSHTTPILPERTSMVIVFVAAFADPEVMAGVTVTAPGLTFTNNISRGTDSVGWAQGGVWTAMLDGFPVDPANPIQVTVAWANVVEKIEYLIYEVTNAGTVGVTGSATRGTHAVGSITGGLVVPLSAASKDYSVVLGFLGVSDEDYNESGAAAGAGFIEEIEILPNDQYAWMSLESSAAVSVSSVTWTAMDLSGAVEGKDAVALCIEILPLPVFAQWSTYDPLMIGGARDAYGGPIYSVEGHTDGEEDWGIDGSGPH